MRLSQAIVAAAVACGGCAMDCQDAPDEPALVQTSASMASGHAASASYRSLLRDLDGRIDGLQARADTRPQDWLIRTHLANALLERAGLTHGMDDYARVQRVLDEAFAIAPEGSGPLMVAARFNFSIHRLDVAEDYLEKMAARPLQKRGEVTSARVLRGEIAFQRGQYVTALEQLSDVAAVAPAAARVELALYHAKTGKPAEAEALLDAALAATDASDPRRRAWIRLQLGLIAMENGRHAQALERLEEADLELSGWWLVQEHLAELHDVLGDHEGAIAIYEEIVPLYGMPQHMDSLAGIYEHMEQPRKAQELIQRAGAIWEEQLSRFPEAAMGHGLSHHLRYGTADRALQLAKANYAVRPGGEAQISLARAYLKAGRPAEALDIAEQALATPYRTAGLHHVASEAHSALGHTAAAEEQRRLCLAINPLYVDQQHTH